LPGAYFVTVCARARECAFEEPDVRDALEEVWRQIPRHFSNARLDEFVVMPNHVHGIVWIVGAATAVGAQHAAPLPDEAARIVGVKPRSLGAIVRSFKSAATRRVNEVREMPSAALWQRNYYERVTRNEDELHRAREYILLNPLRWEHDHDNPHRTVSPEHEKEWGWLEAGR
jgi:REP element-mobilizing transposase RayT